MPDDPASQPGGESDQDDDLDPVIPAELDAELEELPEEIGRKVRMMISASFSGPLPPPDYLAGYEKILPGSADRIIAMAEKQSAHRHSIESRLVDAEIGDQKSDRLERLIGQVFGFLVAITTVITGGLTATYGNAWVGGLIGVGGLTGLVSVFIIGRSRKGTSEEEAEQSDE